MSKRRLWLAVSLAALSSTTGCSTTGELLAQRLVWLKTDAAGESGSMNPGQGNNGQFGTAAATAGTFPAMSASLKKWTGGDQPAQPEDAVSLDSTPKQLSPELYRQIERMNPPKADCRGREHVCPSASRCRLQASGHLSLLWIPHLLSWRGREAAFPG